MATSNAVNNTLNNAGRTNNTLSISQTILAATKAEWDKVEYSTGDPCKDADGTDSIAVEIEKLFIRLKAVQKYGDFYINGAINKVENIQSQISAITTTIASILKTLIQRLRNWVLNKLKALIEEALTYVATNLAKELKKAIVGGIVDQIFCAFEEIIGGLIGLVGDFLYSLIGQIINTPFCAAEQWTNALLDNLISSIDEALAPIFASINDILGGVAEIAGSIYEAIDFILGLQGFLCGAPDCPEVTKFAAGPWGGPTKTQQDNFNNFNFGVSNNLSGEISNQADQYLDDFFGEDSGTLNQSPGSCYTGTFECGIPQIEIFGGGGSGAVGQAVVNTIGEVVGVDLLSGGSGYTSTPFVSIVDPAGCGENASAFAVMGTDEDGYPTGVVDDIVLTNPGYNYDDTYNGGAPVITSFSGAPNPLVVGNSVALSWNVANADTVSLGIAGYTDLSLTGSTTIVVNNSDVTFPTNSDQTTITYTLTATKSNTDSASQTTTKTFILTVLKTSATGTTPGTTPTTAAATTAAATTTPTTTAATTTAAATTTPTTTAAATTTPTTTAAGTTTPTTTAAGTTTPTTTAAGTTTPTTTAATTTAAGTTTPTTTAATTTAAGTTTPTTAAGSSSNTSGTGNNNAVAVVGNIDLISTGIGYTAGDTVTITDDTGTGATAEIQTNQIGQIVGINLISGGYGFTRIPTVRINSFQGVGARFRPRLKFIPLNQFLLEQELQVIDPNKLVQIVDCVSK